MVARQREPTDGGDLEELRVMQKPAGLKIGGFRILAGAWAGFRDWITRSKLRLTIYKDCGYATRFIGQSCPTP